MPFLVGEPTKNSIKQTPPPDFWEEGQGDEGLAFRVLRIEPGQMLLLI